MQSSKTPQQIAAYLKEYQRGQAECTEELTRFNTSKQTILKSLTEAPKKGAGGFIDLCTQLAYSTELQALKPSDKILLLSSLIRNLTSTFTNRASDLYDKFKPAGFFTIFAPTYSVPVGDQEIMLHSSETFRKGLEILHEHKARFSSEYSKQP